MSINRLMDKKDVVCIYIMEYYSAIKKNEIPFAMTWIQLEIHILSKSERQIPCTITYMWNLKYERLTYF